MVLRTIVMAGALFAASGASAAPSLNAADHDFTKPSEFVRILQKAGYRAELKKLDSGRPYVASAADGNDFSIYFYECDATNLVCKSFEFFSWWKKEPSFTPAMVNVWNRDKRFLKAAIDDEGDLTQRLYGTGIGLTEAGFLELLDWYVVMAGEMGKYIDAAAPPKPDAKAK